MSSPILLQQLYLQHTAEYNKSMQALKEHSGKRSSIKTKATNL